MAGHHDINASCSSMAFSIAAPPAVLSKMHQALRGNRAASALMTVDE
jgi:hypothetical protein